MADALGWPWARKSAEVNQQIDAFLSPRHRTQRLGELGTREHDAWTRSTFEVFERWSNSGDDPEGRGVLDQIRASFDAAAPTFAGLLTPARDSRAATDTMNMEETNAPAQAANSAPEAGGEPEQADSSAAEREAEGGEQQQQQPADPSEPSAAENGLPAHAELLSLIDGIRSVQEDLRKEAERRAERLTGDLRGSEQRIAELESNLRQRQEENAQAWVELEREKAARQTAEQKAEELKAAELRVESLTRLLRDAEAKEERLTRDIGALKSEIEDLKSKLSQKESELADKDSALADAEEQKRMSKRTAAILQSEREDALGRLAAVEYELTATKSGLEVAESNLHTARENIDERFAELASLGRILIEEETQRKRLEAQSSWLRQVNEVVLRKGKWWWQLMPREWQRRMRLRQVARAGLFDADAYVRAYPDVAKSGQDPLRHYVAHGLDENRQF
jgi:hypothetical protein